MTAKCPTFEEMVRDYTHVMDKYRAKMGDSFDDFVQQTWYDLYSSDFLGTYKPGGIAFSMFFSQKVSWLASNWISQQKKRSARVVERDLEAIEAEQDIETTVLTSSAIENLFVYLAKHVHEDIPLYLQLSAQGYGDKEIVGDTKTGVSGMLPHLKTTPANFNENYKRHIQPAIVAFERSEEYKKLSRKQAKEAQMVR